MASVRTVAILIFDEVEVLDFCGPFEVFSVANNLSGGAAFHVVTVAEKPGPISTRGGMSVNPTHRIDDCPPIDLLLVPGGQGTRREINNPVIVDWVKGKAERTELTLSVCTGALILAKAGLLDGLSATTHHGAVGLLRQMAPLANIQEARRFVDNGKVLCSAGIAAGIDMSLHVVARLLGNAIAEQTTWHMEYPWTP